jgi:hypothetical protein
MDRWATAVVAGLLGGIGGGLAVRFAVPPPAGSPGAAPESALASREVAEQVAEIRRLLDRPPAASLSPRTGGGTASEAAPGSTLGGSAAGDSPAAVVPGSPRSLSAADLQALADRAAETALERQAQREKDAWKPGTPRMALSDIAREIGLSSSQESELREMYRSRTERYLKLLAAPDGDPEAVRRELTEAKGDPDLVEAVKAKYIPKFLSKLGEVATIEAETAVRVNAVLGSKEAVAKYKKFTPEENDPFGLEANVSVTTRGK